MSFFETEETNQFTFEAFAAHPFYTAINRSLVQQALAPLVTRPPDATLTLVDMACGTGVITRLIAEELAYRGRQARIIAVGFLTGRSGRSSHARPRCRCCFLL